MTTCSVKGCFAEKQSGDTLFCENCRVNWIEQCMMWGIKETIIPEREEDKLIKLFQEHIMEHK